MTKIPILQSGYSGLMVQHSTGIILDKKMNYKTNQENPFILFEDLQKACEYGNYVAHKFEDIEFVIFNKQGIYVETII